MRTDAGLARRAGAAPMWCWAIVAMWSLVTGVPLAAQASLLLINPQTTVRSVDFSFLDRQTFSDEELSGLVTYTDPGGFAGIQRALSSLPLVSAPVAATFQPIELQRDLARLREFYHSSGFPHAVLNYEVRFDQTRNVVRVTHVIREGDPLERGELLVAYPEEQARPGFLPESLVAPWEDFLTTTRPRRGERFGTLERIQIEETAATWLRDRGWAFAEARAEVMVDSVRNVADVLLRVEPGPLAWVDEVRTTGTEQVSPWVVRRAIPLKPGHRFAAGFLRRGQQHLYGLDLVRFANVDVQSNQPIDSTVTILAHVEEGLPRIISGEAGYSSEAGLSAQASWAHRDFFGGARTLTISATAQTAWLGFTGVDATRYGGSVAIKQPFLFDAASTGVLRPYLDYRNDLIDRSWKAGADLTLIYQARPDHSISVGYGLAERRVLEYRGAGAADVDFLTRLAIADSLESKVRTSALTVGWLSESLDDTRNPTRGRVLRGAIQLAGPSAMSSVTYGRFDLSGAMFVPLSRSSTLAARISLGRLFPMGQSVPGPGENPIRSVLLLRDALFTAGGSYDVRGWGERLLGPKTPDAVGDLQAPESLTATRYVPIGGLARMQSTLELRLPMPFLRRSPGIHGFLDTGHVWNPDQRFRTGGADDTRRFFSTGGGIEIASPVGPVRLTLGYKLNPSALDLRDPGEVLQKLIENRSILEAPVRSIRRYHLHLTLGRTF